MFVIFGAKEKKRKMGSGSRDGAEWAPWRSLLKKGGNACSPLVACALCLT